jgi:hypothetical protein
MAAPAHPEPPAKHVELLVRALERRGFTAEAVGAATVRAANHAVGPAEGDPLAASLSPGLSQTVLCRPGEDGRLMWWWVWSGPTREAPSEYEPLGPATEIDATADRIARVLRLDDGRAP